MNIREATAFDVPQLINLGREYWEGQGEPPSLDRLAKFFVDHLTQPADRAVIYVSLRPDHPSLINGGIAGIIAPQLFHEGATAIKTGWFCQAGAKGNGVRLLRRFEAWARLNGASKIWVTGREPRTLEMLSRRGYANTETLYSKGAVSWAA